MKKNSQAYLKNLADKEGNITEKPVPFRDHAMASIRYGIGDNEGVMTFLDKSVQGAERDVAKTEEEMETLVEREGLTGVGTNRDTMEQEW